MSEYLDYIPEVQDVQSAVNDLALHMYEQGREDAFKEIAYSENIIKEPFEIAAYNRGRTDAIEEFRSYLKTVTPCEMPQEMWDMGVDNTCDRMLRGERE